MDPSLYVSSIDHHHHHHPQSDGKVHPNPYNNNVFQAPPHTSFNHPPYFQMISMAIAASNERDGLSKEAISRYIEKNYTGLPALLTRHLKTLKNSRIVDVKKTYKFAASPDACLEVPRSRILATTNDQHTPDLAGVSASQPQKHAGRRGGASNLDDMQPPGRPTKNRAATIVPALVLTCSSSTVCQQRVKEDTVISLSSDSSESDDDESDVSFTLNHKKKGRLVEDDEAMVTNTSCSVKRRKLVPKIKNPEKYLENPENIYFESELKNRPYELLIDAKVVKTHCLKFKECIHYIDSVGKVQSETMKTKDRVCIRYWNRICDRNKLKKEDRVLCELLREGRYGLCNQRPCSPC
ncbi:unnamed protein product [Brassica rapa]|uniref:H15 domain-containing protein n=1 Tax=Brassica campestris TaxID=3711 RepID=A0A8D9LUG2_BRACM|nr:unnamed protein product [Brassica rapa]